MITHNVCFHGEIRKISAFFGSKKHLICCYAVTWNYADTLFSRATVPFFKISTSIALMYNMHMY